MSLEAVHPVQVKRYDLVPYGEALVLQRDARDALLAGNGDEILLVLEHPHVVTYGKRTPAGDLTLTELEREPGDGHERLSSPPSVWSGVEAIQVERGGLATYHAPGQLVVYPILDLRRRGWSVRGYLAALQTATVGLLSEFGLSACCGKHEAGIWVGARKIASFGIHIRRGVSIHGLALNVSVDLDGFRRIRPCGEGPEVMTSMVRELLRPVSREEVEPVLVARLLEAFMTGQGCGVRIR